MKDNEIIKEVRAARRARAARCNHDLDLIFEDIKRGEKELQQQGWKFVFRPAAISLEELRRRIKEIETGKAKGRPAAEVLREIRAKYKIRARKRK